MEIRSNLIFAMPILFSAVLSAQSPTGGTSPAPRSAVVILGDGTPLISAERSGTSIGIVVRGTLYVFDAGPGVERRILEAKERLRLGIRRQGPVFITHLHSDHTLGLPELLYYPGAPALHVIGPPGIKNMLHHLMEAWREDIQVRAHNTMTADSAMSAMVDAAHADEVTRGVAYQDSNVTVTAFEVQHGNWEHALGYRVQAPDRVIVISGDTRPSESVVTACNGCDILLHEVYGGVRSLSGGALTYFKEFHTSTSELGEIARRAKPKVLVMYHQLFFGDSPADMIRDIMVSFRGPVISARDLDVY